MRFRYVAFEVSKDPKVKTTRKCTEKTGDWERVKIWIKIWEPLVRR